MKDSTPPATTFSKELISVTNYCLRFDLAIGAMWANPSVSNATDLAIKVLIALSVISSTNVLGTAFGLYLLAMGIFQGAAIGTYLKNANIDLPNIKDFFPKDNVLWKIVSGILIWFSLVFFEQHLQTLITWFFGFIGVACNQAQDRALLVAAEGLTGILFTILLCIVAPFFEEVLFRGYVEKILEGEVPPSFGQKLMTAFKTNVIFGAIHMSPFQGWFNIPIFVSTFLTGMTCSLLKDSTGDLWAPTAYHTTNNTVATIACRMWSPL